MTPTEARKLAECFEHMKLPLNWDEDAAKALRALADQVEELEGQALSSVEREEYFAMKKDANLYREALKILDGFKGPPPTKDQWDGICALAQALKEVIAREETWHSNTNAIRP